MTGHFSYPSAGETLWQVSSKKPTPAPRYVTEKVETPEKQALRQPSTITLTAQGTRKRSPPHGVQKPTCNRRKTEKKKKRKQGGWKVTTAMSYADAKSIKDDIHRLKSSRIALNYFITIQPPPEIHDDQSRKVWCRRKIDTIRRRFFRHGNKFISLVVYEKSLTGRLHVHLLVHVPNGFGSLVMTYHTPPEIDVRRSVRKHENYVLKCRLPAHPDVEVFLRTALPRVKAAPFRGKRWLWTADAKLELIKRQS